MGSARVASSGMPQRITKAKENLSLNKVKDHVVELQNFIEDNRNVYVPIKKAVAELGKHVNLLKD